MTAQNWQEIMILGGIANLAISSGALIGILRVAFMFGKMQQKLEDHDRRLEELEMRQPL